MSERTTRRLLVGVVLVGCFGPTAGIVGLNIYHRSDAFRNHLVDSFRQWCAAEASLGGAATPRPGVIRLDDIVLRRPLTGTTFAEIDQLRIASVVAAEDDTGPESARRVRLTCRNVTISAEALPALRERLEEIVAGRRGSLPCPVEFEFSETTLLGAGGDDAAPAVQAARALREIRGTIEPIPGGMAADFVCRFDDEAVARFRFEAVVENGLVLHRCGVTTGETRVDNAFLGLVWPQWQVWAPQGQFAGYVWCVEREPGRWSGELTGEISGIASALPWSAGMPVNHVHVSQFRWEPGEITAGRITLTGVDRETEAFNVSLDVCRRWAAHFGTLSVPVTMTPSLPKTITVRRVGAEFYLLPEGVYVRGTKDMIRQDCLAEGENNQLIVVTGNQPIPWSQVLSLIRSSLEDSELSTSVKHWGLLQLADRMQKSRQEELPVMTETVRPAVIGSSLGNLPSASVVPSSPEPGYGAPPGDAEGSSARENVSAAISLPVQ
ncbi:hypothetical protein JCM19992_17310 [Thermostilla marina]